MKVKDAMPILWEYVWNDYGNNNSMVVAIYSAKRKGQSAS